MARKRREIALPWEQRGRWLGRLVAGSRIRAGLLALGVLTVAGLLYRSADHRSRVRETRVAIVSVRRAIDQFRADHGRCPRSTTELQHPPRTGTRYLRRTPKDGWGRELHVACPGQADPDDADVISAGPSGSFHEHDNIY